MKLALALLLPAAALATPLQPRQATSGSGSAASATPTSSGSAAAAGSASASPTSAAAAISTGAGFSTYNTFPASGVTANHASFPDESQVGIPGPTPTGIEPRLISYPSAYPYKNYAFPLINGAPSGSGQQPVGSESLPSGSFNIFRYFGNLSPWHSNNNAKWSVKTASPDMPNNCTITQVHLLYRHGARYPTTGSVPAQFAVKVQNATKAGGFQATGDLSFLNTWQYNLGAELLTPFGRLQNFELGVGFRQLYGRLLNNFTAQGTVPVFRTESQDRMVKTALNFMAGFFGVPEYQTQANLLITPEVSGVNNTGASYETCTNSNNARGAIGTAASNNFTASYFQNTASRIQSLVQGINITTTDIVGMLQLCAYETDANGWSPFCQLFTEDDFKALEYSFDLSFYYNQGIGSPVGAAQGIGYVEELLSRLTQVPLTSSNSTVNTTIQNPTQMPLNQSIYADATHEVILLDVMTALNLTSIFGDPLPVYQQPDSQTFVASELVPFGTHLVIQVMECSTSQPTKQMRFIINDGVVPLTYSGCNPQEPNGLCAYDTVVAALQNRVGQVNFAYDCLANYTVPAGGQNLNGRAPQPSSSASSGGSSASSGVASASASKSMSMSMSMSASASKSM